MERHPEQRRIEASAHLWPGASRRQRGGQREQNDSVDNIQTSNPYDHPTLNDLTTDVNFSLLDVEGRQAGLRTLFYGSQKALQSGTPISLDEVPERARRDNRVDQFLSWA